MNTPPSTTDISQALIAGQVIAYPTEAVWGLGCDPTNEDAVKHLLSLKSRSVEKGLILISGDIAHFSDLLMNLDDKCRQKLESTWPGPYTWLVPHHNNIPAWISGRFDTVAIRVTNHPTVKAITDGFGGAIVSTSANPQGLEPAMNADQVCQYFSSDDVIVTGGDVGEARKPSEVRHAITDELIRAGG